MGVPRRPSQPLSDDERDAFDRLYRRWSRFVQKRAFRLTKRADAADQLTQETFAHAARKYHQLRLTDRPSGWLLRILHSRYRDGLARKGPDVPSPVPPAGSPAPPEFPLAELLTQVPADRFTSREREYLAAAAPREFDHAATALALGVSRHYARRLKQLVTARLDSWHVFTDGPDGFRDAFEYVAGRFAEHRLKPRDLRYLADRAVSDRSKRATAVTSAVFQLAFFVEELWMWWRSAERKRSASADRIALEWMATAGRLLNEWVTADAPTQPFVNTPSWPSSERLAEWADGALRLLFLARGRYRDDKTGPDSELVQLEKMLSDPGEPGAGLGAIGIHILALFRGVIRELLQSSPTGSG